MNRLLSRIEPHDRSALPLEVSGLGVRFNGTWALNGVSFALPEGSRTAVVGPNGAGKTTLLKVIAGTLRPTSGNVRVYGHGPGGHVCIAYVPQRSQIDWGFPVTVAEVVMMGRTRKIGLLRWPGRDDWRVVRQALEQIGLADQADCQIGELSGGQQQRAFLAQALAQEAELILLDEPFTGLDLPSQETIFQLLDELRRRRVTVMVSTHDLNLAAERFDQAMLLNRRLIAFGPPRQVFNQEHLLSAYGGHVHLLPGGEGVMVLTDTCCEGGEETA
ncbi:MAG: metal ABC transporter ATP-binding protein [Chloroflexota bacterium]